MKGFHILASFVECGCDENLLLRAENASDLIEKIIMKSGLKIEGTKYKNFAADNTTDQYGWTGMVVLAESHAGLHTYPEENSLFVDIFVCHYERDNTDKAQRVFAEMKTLFQPSKIEKHWEIER